MTVFIDGATDGATEKLGVREVPTREIAEPLASGV